MSERIEAIYEDGVLKPLSPPPLAEHQQVDLVIVSKGPVPLAQLGKPTLEELIKRSGATAVSAQTNFFASFWPDDEPIDEFVQTVRAWRDADLAK